MNKYYKLEDLHVGMRVNTFELSKIYDAYIYLEDTKSNGDGSTTGTIVYVGKKQTKETLNAVNASTEKYGKRPMVFTHSSKLIGGYYSFE